jgi:hypothetical protein
MIAGARLGRACCGGTCFATPISCCSVPVAAPVIFPRFSRFCALLLQFCISRRPLYRDLQAPLAAGAPEQHDHARLGAPCPKVPISHLGKMVAAQLQPQGVEKMARGKWLIGGPGKIDVNMEQAAYMRTAPNGFTEIIFTTGDSVQVQETMDEIHHSLPDRSASATISRLAWSKSRPGFQPFAPPAPGRRRGAAAQQSVCVRASAAQAPHFARLNGTPRPMTRRPD